MVRVYGESIDQGSFSRVAAGMRLGLSEHGQLSGFVPIDAYDGESFYEGADSEVAVFSGAPNQVSIMTSIGWHKNRWALLAANSTWLPVNLLRSMEEHVTGFIAPSSWGQGILQRYTSLPVSVWHHGVDPKFIPNESDRLSLLTAYEQGWFSVAHLASTTMQRKGTRQLLLAWIRAVSEGKLGSYPLLHLVVNGSPEELQKEAQEAPGSNQTILSNTIIWSRRWWNMTVDQAAHYYRKHHLIAQPSRGEGFGMVPLEARACGVPVLMTACTGHADHVMAINEINSTEANLSPPIIVVKTGGLVPIDDGPGALAPELEVDAVYEALKTAYETWPDRFHAAAYDSKRIRGLWNWPETTRRWLVSTNQRGS